MIKFDVAAIEANSTSNYSELKLTEAVKKVRYTGAKVPSELVEATLELADLVDLEESFFDELDRTLILMMVAAEYVDAGQRYSGWRYVAELDQIVNLLALTATPFSQPLQRATGYGEDDSALIRHQAIDQFTNPELTSQMKHFMATSDLLEPLRSRMGYEQDLEFEVRVLDVSYGPLVEALRPAEVDFDNAASFDEAVEEFERYAETLTQNTKAFVDMTNKVEIPQAWVLRGGDVPKLCLPRPVAEALLFPAKRPSTLNASEVKQLENIVVHEMYHTQSAIARSLDGVELGLGLEEVIAEVVSGTNGYPKLKKHFVALNHIDHISLGRIINQFGPNKPFSMAKILLDCIEQVGLLGSLDLLCVLPESTQQELEHQQKAGVLSDRTVLEFMRNTGNIKGMQEKLWNQIVEAGRTEQINEKLAAWGTELDTKGLLEAVYEIYPTPLTDKVMEAHTALNR